MYPINMEHKSWSEYIHEEEDFKTSGVWPEAFHKHKRTSSSKDKIILNVHEPNSEVSKYVNQN